MVIIKKEVSGSKLETTEHVSDRTADMDDRSSERTKRFAFIGMLGGFIRSIADYLPDYLGALPNRTAGAYGAIETAWADMAARRLPASYRLVRVLLKKGGR